MSGTLATIFSFEKSRKWIIREGLNGISRAAGAPMASGCPNWRGYHATASSGRAGGRGWGPPFAGRERRAARAGGEESLLEVWEWLFEPPAGARRRGRSARHRGAARRRSTRATPLVLLAVADGDRVVGLCTAYYTIHAIRRPRAWVEELAVDPELRSRGIGSRLLAAAGVGRASAAPSHLKLDSALAHRGASVLRARGPDAAPTATTASSEGSSPPSAAARRGRGGTQPAGWRPPPPSRRPRRRASTSTPPVFVLPTMQPGSRPGLRVDHALEIDPVALEGARPFEPRCAESPRARAPRWLCPHTPGRSSPPRSPAPPARRTLPRPAVGFVVIQSGDDVAHRQGVLICSTRRTASADTGSDYPSPAASPTSRGPWP